MRFFEDHKTVFINNQQIVIRRAGIRYFWILYEAVIKGDAFETIKALTPFLSRPLKGKWKKEELKLLGEAIIEHNSPPKVVKHDDEEQGATEQVRLTPDEMAEHLMFEVVKYTGWTLEYIAEEVSYCKIMQLIAHRKNGEEDENIREMINISYGHSGQVGEYIRRVKMKRENLDRWAKEMGFGDYKGFLEAEKERWKDF